MNEFNTPSSALDIARGLEKIYSDFISSIEALGSKARDKKRSSKLAGSFAHWIGGSHVTTDREALCEQFILDVEKHLETLVMVLEVSSPEECREAARFVCNLMYTPIPPRSDATTDLMRRAMVGKSAPVLPYLTAEDRESYAAQFEKSYGRFHQLPVEKEMIETLRG